MPNIKVKNLHGTSKESHHCKCCNTWLEHWEKHKKTKAYKCMHCDENCEDTPLVGAHVQKIAKTDKKWYIIPFCQKCNKSDEELIIDDYYLVPVDACKNN